MIKWSSVSFDIDNLASIKSNQVDIDVIQSSFFLVVKNYAFSSIQINLVLWQDHRGYFY